MRRPFTIRTPTAMTVYGDMGYVVAKCPCGWYVTTGSLNPASNPHVGVPVPLYDFSTAEKHATSCSQARPTDPTPAPEPED